MNARFPLLSFRCTRCGNCCRDPLLPVTKSDLQRIVRRTNFDPRDVLRWVSRDDIDFDEQESFVELRQGPRLMVLRHRRTGCLFLGPDLKCTIYSSRPLGCRAFPFDPDFDRRGNLKRLRLIQATECPYTLDGHNRVDDIRRLDWRYGKELADYHAQVEAFNLAQHQRRRQGESLLNSSDFLVFLGFSLPRRRPRSKQA